MAYAEILKVLIAWALFLTGYEDPGGYPEITYLSTEDLNKMVCPQAPNGCGIRALYTGGVIYLNENDDIKTDPFARSILIHEITHWLQDQYNDYPIFGYEACVKANQREVEAYGVQNAYLRQGERSSLTIQNNPPLCARFYKPKLNIR